MSVTIWLLY